MNVDPNTGRIVHGGIIERDMRPIAKITVRQAAAHYGVSVTTIYRRVRAGRIVATKNTRGHWEIVEAPTMELAELAADMRDRLTARAALNAAPVHTCQSYDPQGYADDLYARRRAAMARRTLIAA
jgi:excisionase family DNA binding protein